jgi:hypothetical protein
MKRFWQILERATLRVGDAEATGFGVVCLTIIFLSAIAIMGAR